MICKVANRTLIAKYKKIDSIQVLFISSKCFISQYKNICLTICALQKSRGQNLIYYLKSFLLIDFCFLFVCMNHSCQ